MKSKTFACGCTIPIVNGSYDFRFNKLRLDCPITWDLFREGNTKGIFQLERQGYMAKKVEPTTIDELSDLVAIIRPGVKNSFIDGISLTDHYVERKHGRKPVDYVHDSMREILKPTQGILVYQEQAMRIAVELAAFTLSTADSLRKAIGKKKADLMAEMKTLFLEGAKSHGVITNAEAEEIFSWIEASQRYSFNLSHSVSYAANAYQTAYCKAHFPRSFFTSYLRHSIGKPDMHEEIKELIDNAREMDIDIAGPSIHNINMDFDLINNTPTFGLTEIKGVGQSVFDKMQVGIKEQNIDFTSCSWDRFLTAMYKYIKSNSFQAMINSGALDCFSMTRKTMIHEHSMFSQISDRELPYIQEYVKNNPEHRWVDAVRDMMMNNDWTDKKRPIFREARMEALDDILRGVDNPGFSLKDSPEAMATKEAQLLGTALTCSKVDQYQSIENNCTCREYNKGFESQSGIHIIAELQDVREYQIKKGNSKGQKMAFLKIGDSSGSLDNVVLFSDQYAKHKSILISESVLLFSGVRDDRGSLRVQKVQQVEGY